MKVRRAHPALLRRRAAVPPTFGSPGTSTPCARARPAAPSERRLRNAGRRGPRAGRRAAAVAPRRRAARIRRREISSTPSSSLVVERRRAAATSEMRASQSTSARQRLPMPATRRWSRSASPISRSCGVARSRESIVSKSAGSPRMSGPRRGADRLPTSSSTEPFQRTASYSAPRRTSHGRPARVVPRRSTRHLPFMRR